MNYYKATIQYDGTNYFGFQWQKDIPTVQSDFNLTLEKLLPGKITTLGASRTDSGVHALEQVVKITAVEPISCDDFLVLLNELLPPQIKCLSLCPCEGTFNPISHRVSKEYRYFFTNKLKSRCDDQRFIANTPYEIDVEAMKESALLITGHRSFHNFFSAGSNVKTTIRHITLCELSEVDPREVIPQDDLFRLPEEQGRCYRLRIEGNGFLKQMVRHLMSALWLVGNGRLSPEEFSKLLDGPQKEKRLWKVASPRGLFLYRFK